MCLSDLTFHEGGKLRYVVGKAVEITSLIDGQSLLDSTSYDSKSRQIRSAMGVVEL